MEAVSIRADEIAGKIFGNHRRKTLASRKDICSRSEEHDSDLKNTTSHIASNPAAMARIKRGRRCRRLVQIWFTGDFTATHPFLVSPLWPWMEETEAP